MSRKILGASDIQREDERPIGKILLEERLIAESQIQEALNLQKRYPEKRIGEILRDLHYVTDAEVTEAVAVQYGLEYIGNLPERIIPKEALEAIPEEVARRHVIFPLDFEKGSHIKIALSEPFDLYAIDNVAYLLENIEVRTALAPASHIQHTIDKFYRIQRKS